MLQAVRSYRHSIAALVLVAAIAVVLMLAVPSSTRASDTTRSGHDFTYYSDATYTTVVGYRFWCIGYQGGWGQVTPYSIIDDFPCN